MARGPRRAQRGDDRVGQLSDVAVGGTHSPRPLRFRGAPVPAPAQLRRSRDPRRGLRAAVARRSAFVAPRNPFAAAAGGRALAVRRPRGPAHRSWRRYVADGIVRVRGRTCDAGRDRLAPVVPQARPARIRAECDLPARRGRHCGSAIGGPVAGTVGRLLPQRSADIPSSWRTTRAAHVRLQPVGGLRRNRARHLRRAAERSARCVQSRTGAVVAPGETISAWFLLEWL